MDLASFYASKGGVDLGTLSELTKSVGVSDDNMENSRSKRTCVRVREEISKLEEILKDDSVDTKASTSKSRGGGRGRGRGSTTRTSLEAANQLGEMGADELGGVAVVPAAKKYKKPAYSQFTHKRRKRKRKPPEEGKRIR